MGEVLFIAGVFVVFLLFFAYKVRTYRPWVQGTYRTPTTSTVNEYGNCSGGMCMPSRGENLTGWTPAQGQRYDRAEQPYQATQFSRGDQYADRARQEWSGVTSPTWGAPEPEPEITEAQRLEPFAAWFRGRDE